MVLRRQAKRWLRRATTNDYQTLNIIGLHQKRLLHNVQFFQQRWPELAVIPVLKGNAYGHGIEQVARMLNDVTVPLLAVDGYFEAAKIRDVTKHRILVMGYILPANVKLLDTKRCSFVVQDAEGLKAFATLRRPVQIHLELNTGINRLGLTSTEIANYLAILRQNPKLQLEGVMTHLADADNPADVVSTNQQIAYFDRAIEQIVAAGFQPTYIHAFQTAGAPKAHSRYANTMRLGIGLYGLNPLSPDDSKYQDFSALQPILELDSTIIKVLDLKPGERVSYNGIFTAPRKMKIAVLPLGYYEGLPRALSNVGTVTYRHTQLPIVGRVCMNHTMIDIGNLDLKVGDRITVINSDLAQSNSIAGWQREHDIFSYNSVTNLAETIRRVVL